MPRHRRFSVDEYEQMGRVGILRENERVELLGGEIFEMAAMGSRHAARLRFLDHWFGSRLAGRAITSLQSPVRLSDGSEPEPDLALLQPRADDYEEAHPGPDNVLLLIEVADTSLAYDLQLKLPRYAEAGITEVWIVDLVANRVLGHRDPSPTGYLTTVTLARGDKLTPAAFPELVLAVTELLP